MKILILLLLPFVFLNAFTLKEGFELALENNMDFKVNKNNLKNIEYDQEIANALLYPTIDFTATVETKKLTQDKTFPGSASHTDSDEYKLKLTQPIFDGFQSSFEKDLQKERFKSAIYYLKESKDKVAIEYISAYINTLREKDLLSLNKERLAISQDTLNKVYKKVNSGYGTKLEYEKAKGELAENRVNLNIQRINLKESIENLKLYVQSDFDTSELVKPTTLVSLPRTLTAALKTAYKENPSINVTKANVKVATFEERKTTKDFYPDLDFVGTYQLNNALHAQEDEKYNEYSVGLQLTYNLFNGGKDTLKNKKALQNIKDKQLLVKKSEFEVKNKLRLAWNNYKLNEEKKKSLEQYLLVKKDILDSTIKEFDLGLKNLTSLLDTQVEYIDVKKDLISNSYDLLLTKYKVLDAMGKLTEALENGFPKLDKIDTKELVKNNTLDDSISYTFNDDNRFEKKIIKKKQDIEILETKKVQLFDIPEITLPKKEKLVKRAKYQEIVQPEVIVQIKKPVKTYTKYISFKERFLTAPKSKYTINLAHSDSVRKAQELLDRNKLNGNAFYFSFRKVKPLQRIVMGVYDNLAEAKKAYKSLPKELKRNKPVIERISKKQKVYFKYHKDIVKPVEPKIKIVKKIAPKKTLVRKVSFSTIKPKSKKVSSKSVSYNNFKDKFLNASKDKYTINLAYSDSKTKAQALLNRYGMSKNGFIFQFRNEKPLQRIVYGVFNSKEEAQKVLAGLDKRLKKNNPIIEKITRKQKTFHKYNKYTKPSSLLGSI